MDLKISPRVNDPGLEEGNWQVSGLVPKASLQSKAMEEPANSTAGDGGVAGSSTPEEEEAAAAAAASASTRGGGDEDDVDVLQFLDSLDGYVTLVDSLSSTLRQGWFELAGARQSMGPSRISGALLDLKVKSAPTTLQMTLSDGGSPSEPEPQFSLSKWASSIDGRCSSLEVQDKLSQTDFKSSQIRHRGSAHLPEGDQKTSSTTTGSTLSVDDKVPNERMKTLTVFGTLVSPKLRSAQGSFETALETIVEIANLRSRMLSSFSRLELEK